MPAMNRIYYTLQHEMSRAGGRLPGLVELQNPDRIGDNNIEQESTTPPQEGTIMMNNAAVNLNPNTAPTNDVPPAGGPAENAFGKEVRGIVDDFLKDVGLGHLVTKPTWKDKVLDNAIPVGRVIVGVLLAEGAIALVQRQVQKSRAKKELAAAKAEAQLSESINS